MKAFAGVLVGYPGGVIGVTAKDTSLISELRDKFIHAVNQYDEQPRIRCAADRVKLYPAKINGSWLKTSDPRVKRLYDGEIPDDIQSILRGEEIHPTWRVRRISNGRTPEGAIQILIVPQPRASKWEETVPWKPHDYDSSQQYFQLDEVDTRYSGLGTQVSMPYCRPNFHEQFQFMKEHVCDEGRLSMVTGPEGTGKSCTAMAFATTLDPSQWIVTWIHALFPNHYWCVRLSGGERKTLTATDDELDELLNSDESEKRHLLLVDDWNDKDFPHLNAKCAKWFLDRKKGGRRRLAFICSMEFYEHVHEKFTGRRIRVKEFSTSAWILNEYHAATKNDKFYESVSSKLDAPDVVPLSTEGGVDNGDGEKQDDVLAIREKVVNAKHRYAGGCCCFMFEFCTDKVRSLQWSRQHTTAHQFWQ